MKTLVLGIGNTLLTDEGVGIHVLQALAPELANWPDVTLLDGGTLPTGEAWLAMEFVDGEPVTRYVAGRQLGLAARLRRADVPHASAARDPPAWAR